MMENSKDFKYFCPLRVYSNTWKEKICTKTEYTYFMLTIRCLLTIESVNILVFQKIQKLESSDDYPSNSLL